MSQTTTVLPFVNNAMKLVLRSPVCGMVSKFTAWINLDSRHDWLGT